MKRFNLNEYFKDINQKVVTREGRQVRIICTDAPVKNYPIAGYVTGIDEKWHGPYSWSRDGDREIASPVPSANDLFFLDKEENMTEFEKEVDAIMDVEAKSVLGVKYEAKYLLDIARKQLQPEVDKEIDAAYKTRDKVVYLEGYNKGKEDALKDRMCFNIEQFEEWVDVFFPDWFNKEEVFNDFKKFMEE